MATALLSKADHFGDCLRQPDLTRSGPWGIEKPAEMAETGGHHHSRSDCRRTQCPSHGKEPQREIASDNRQKFNHTLEDQLEFRDFAFKSPRFSV